MAECKTLGRAHDVVIGGGVGVARLGVQMPPMPYYLEKGPMLSVLDDYANSDTQRAVEMLRTLRIEDPATTGYVELWDLPPFTSANLGAKPGNPYWMDFRDKWLGRKPQNPADPKEPHGQDAMMWVNYRGNVDLITRRTMRDALEVALGVDEDQPVPDDPPRHWPIDLFWKCGQNWFEGWVMYRRLGDGSGDGHVTVIFATPSEGTAIVDRPADSDVLLTAEPDFAVNPTSTRMGAEERTAGMRVITHRHNDAKPSWEVEVTPVGETFQVVLNPAQYVGDDELGLVKVRPSLPDGGIRHPPFPYEAPATTGGQ